jgi:MSHA biogenesis protein MshI
VDFLPTGVAVTAVPVRGREAGRIRLWDFLPAAGEAEQQRLLCEWVEQHRLRKSPCHCLMAPHDVQILQLERPPVEENELAEAIKWKIKDLIGFDVEQAVIEVFELPPRPKNPRQQINAVVCSEPVVRAYIDRVTGCGLDLKVLDVQELALRNLRRVMTFPEKRSLALLDFLDHEGLLTLYHGPNLHVARDFKIGLHDIESAGEDSEALYDQVLLELQRSMDYFESTYELPLPRRLLMYPQRQKTERMAKYLQNFVGFDVDFISLQRVGGETAMALDPQPFPAYCAALRGVQTP